MQRPTRRFEHDLHRRGFHRVAGVDEVGRGAWAGPLVAAAVVLPEDEELDGVADSKVLTRRARERLFPLIQDVALSWGIGVVSAEELDVWGVGAANRVAMVRALDHLSVGIEHAICDGTLPVSWNVPVTSRIDADAKDTCVAAASIIAKVVRDALMADYHRVYPLYGFHEHVGYGAPVHRAALDLHGLTPIHRLSFAPMRQMVSAAL